MEGNKHGRHSMATELIFEEYKIEIYDQSQIE